MSSQARIDANRRNALKSTGPRTSEGKARSSQNACRHGLAAFKRLLAGYLRTYNPAHADEVDLLTDAVFYKWRQQRLWNIEAQTIEMAVTGKKFPIANVAAQVANAFKESSDPMQLIRRYETQLHEQYIRNLRMLRELQASRTHLEPMFEEELGETPARPNKPKLAAKPERPLSFGNSLDGPKPESLASRRNLKPPDT
jgi:hypothetical protein